MQGKDEAGREELSRDNEAAHECRNEWLLALHYCQLRPFRPCRPASLAPANTCYVATAANNYVSVRRREKSKTIGKESPSRTPTNMLNLLLMCRIYLNVINLIQSVVTK